MDDNSKKSYIISNSLGVLFDDKVILYRAGNDTHITLGDLRKVFLKKKRNYYWNMCLILLLLLLLPVIYIFNLFPEGKIIILLFILLVAILSFLFKMYSYKLILLQKRDFTEIDISYQKKEDAKMLIAKLNTKIKAIRRLEELIITKKKIIY